MSPENLPSVGIVLVNYRGADDVIECVNHLNDLDYPKERIEVIVVDNDSGDGSEERIRSEVPHVRVLQSGTNRGFAGGCNFGVANCQADIIAFINSDARPDREWVSAAVAVLASDPGIGCVASRVLDWDGSTVDYVDGALSWFGMGYKREVLQPAEGQFLEEKNVLFATGAAMFVPRAVFNELGGFDERFFMFFEDVDFGWRLNLLGYTVRYSPASVAYHRHHVAIKKFGAFRETYLLERNALLAMYKNLGSHLLQVALGAAIALSAALQVAVVNLGFLNAAFGTVPLSLSPWGVCVAMASLVLWATELRKLIARALDRMRSGAGRAAASGARSGA